jgi:hypothetical protein
MLSVNRIESVVARKRLEHHELRHAWPSATAMRRVCDREGVYVARVPVPKTGLYCYGGEWTLLLSSHNPREMDAYWMLHELAHLWLHHDPIADRDETVYTILPNEARDSRESDVAIFCASVFRDTRRVERHLPQRVAVAAIAAAYLATGALVACSAVERGTASEIGIFEVTTPKHRPRVPRPLEPINLKRAAG